MKIKITRPDGTVIEAEGTPEECATFCGETSRPAYVPTYVPMPVCPAPFVTAPMTWPAPWWATGITTTDLTTATFVTARGIEDRIVDALNAAGRDGSS